MLDRISMVSKNARTIITCNICMFGLIITLVAAIMMTDSSSVAYSYENNENVDMDLTHVTGSVVVWGTGQASITQRFFFILESSNSYSDYKLEGLYWETNERVLANSTKAAIYTTPGASSGPQYWGSYSKDSTKTPTADVVTGGKQINANGLAFSGAAKVYWCLEVSYNTENMIMFYDDGRTLPEDQTLPGTLVGDRKTQFVFFPPTFAKDYNGANYTYDIILANRTLVATGFGYEFNDVSLGINSTFVNNVANFTWVSSSTTYFPPKTFYVTNVTDASNVEYNNSFTVSVSNPSVYHTSSSDSDGYISFDINGTAMGIYGPMEHPNQSFNTELPGLDPDSLFFVILLGGIGLSIFLAFFVPFFITKIGAGVYRMRENAKLAKERKVILQRISAKGFIVPKKSQENLVYLRALEETIYSEHFQELFERKEITREDLMTDQNQDGKVDEKDIKTVVEKQVRAIFEKDILDELQKGGLIE